MYCLTYKRLALRSDAKVQTVAWSKSDNHLGIGGLNGQLKVVKLEETSSQFGAAAASKQAGFTSTANNSNATTPGQATGGKAAHHALALNLDLGGHEGSVQKICWNDMHGKMTTGDDRGAVIVWVLKPGPQFVEEMVNYREKTAVVGMKWDFAGSKICIVYSDGTVMAGTVAGQRLWSQQIADAFVPCWSPDNQQIVLGLTTHGRVLLYDEAGVQQKAVKIQVFGDAANVPTNASVADIKWFSRVATTGSATTTASTNTAASGLNVVGGSGGPADTGGIVVNNNQQPTLAICFTSGRVQLMTDENDEDPRMFDTRMNITCCEWNPLGDLLCIGGKSGKSRNPGGTVILYSAFGQLLFNFFVAPNDVLSCDFDRTGLKLAVACEATCHIFRIFPLIKYAFFNNVLVYTHTTNDNNNLPDGTLMFYDISATTAAGSVGGGRPQRSVWSRKFPARIIALCAHTEFCCAAYQLSNDNDAAPQTCLTLMNSQGVVVDGAYTILEADFMGMNASHIVVANRNALFVWQYRSSVFGGTGASGAGGGFEGGAVSASSQRAKRELYFHVDDKSGASTGGAGTGDDGVQQDLTLEARAAKYQRLQKHSEDPIRAISVSAERFAVVRRTGCVQLYALPGASLERVVSESLPLPRLIALNCDSSKAAVISESGELCLLKFEGTKAGSDGYERDALDDRTGCWSLMWAQDDADMFILCEKNRCYVFRGRHPDEPLALSGYCCQFRDLTCTLFRYHHFFQTPALRSNPASSVSSGAALSSSSSSLLVEQIEVKALRDTRNLLEKVSVAEAIAFVDQNHHKHLRLWSVIAEHCLRTTTTMPPQQPDLASARLCYVKMRDYTGIQFCKKLQLIQDPLIVRADIAAYFGDAKSAEHLYLQADRKDLVLEMHRMLGNWRAVLHLAKELNMDNYVEEANNELGEILFSKCQYRDAMPFLRAAKSYEKLVQACFLSSKFDDMKLLVREIPDKHAALGELGRLFMQLGMAEESSTAYIRAGEYEQAVRVCCRLCEFDLAREIAQKLNVKTIDVQAEKEQIIKELQVSIANGQQMTTTTTNGSSAVGADLLLTSNKKRPAVENGASTPASAATTATSVLSLRKQIEVLWKSAEILRRAGSNLDVAQKIYEIAEIERQLLLAQRQAHVQSDTSAGQGVDFLASARLAVGDDADNVNVNNNFMSPASATAAAPHVQQLMRVKKMYVLAAVALDQHWRSASKSSAAASAAISSAMTTTAPPPQDTSSKKPSAGEETTKRSDAVGAALENLLHKDAETANMDYKFLNNPWKSAEAYHYFILAQQQLYAEQFKLAMRTSILCREYTEFLNAVDVYALMTLCACLNRDWYVTNQAIIRLKDQQDLPDTYQKEVDELARKIFSKHSPAPPPPHQHQSGGSGDNPVCINCNNEIPAWYLSCQNERCKTPRFPICVVTGQIITDRSLWQCWRCKRHAKNDAIAQRSCCPLCHADKKLVVSQQRS